MKTFEARLARQVLHFRAWLAATYPPATLAAHCPDDAGYPGWPAAERLVAELLQAGGVRQLGQAAQADLLYLVARNWDIGSLLAWLSEGPQLSNVGLLTEVDFLQLADRLAELPLPEYDDARYQFAACCRKLPALSGAVQALLLALFHVAGQPYTQQQALRSLAHLGYAGLRQLLPLAWAAAGDEHHQLAVLHVVATYVPDPELLGHYLALAAAVPGPYLAQLVQQLRQLYL